MRRRVDLHEIGDPTREPTHVLSRAIELATPLLVYLVGVEKQLHLKSLEVAIDELDERRAQPGDRGLGEIIVLVERVLFRVEHHRDTLPSDGIRQDRFLERRHD